MTKCDRCDDETFMGEMLCQACTTMDFTEAAIIHVCSQDSFYKEVIGRAMKESKGSINPGTVSACIDGFVRRLRGHQE